MTAFARKVASSPIYWNGAILSSVASDEEAAARLGQNVRQLRAARGLTQAQIARLAGLPRATWANLETGAANPTLIVLAVLGVMLIGVSMLYQKFLAVATVKEDSGEAAPNPPSDDASSV